MRRNRLKLIFMILFTGTLILGFQNCAKLKPEEVVCDENNSENCSLANTLSTPVVVSMSNAKFEFYSELSSQPPGGIYHTYVVDLESDNAVNQNNSQSCNLINNPHWQKFKSMMQEKGLCKYSYSLPPGSAVCLALALPYGRVFQEGDDQDSGVFLSGSICSHSHIEVCGAENVSAFRMALSDLKSEIQAGTACD